MIGGIIGRAGVGWPMPGLIMMGDAIRGRQNGRPMFFGTRGRGIDIEHNPTEGGSDDSVRIDS